MVSRFRRRARRSPTSRKGTMRSSSSRLSLTIASRHRARRDLTGEDLRRRRARPYGGRGFDGRVAAGSLAIPHSPSSIRAPVVSQASLTRLVAWFDLHMRFGRQRTRLRSLRALSASRHLRVRSPRERSAWREARLCEQPAKPTEPRLERHAGPPLPTAFTRLCPGHAHCCAAAPCARDPVTLDQHAVTRLAPLRASRRACSPRVQWWPCSAGVGGDRARRSTTHPRGAVRSLGRGSGG